jgi:heme/copper-type cytochrome/quinol oxidase subunit 2
MTVLLLALAPAKLQACAACYGGSNIDSPMADGMNWAILTLGTIILTVLGAFLAFLVYAIRRSEALESANLPAGTVKPAGRRQLSAESILITETPIHKPA